MKTGLLFDLDGTLLDTLEDLLDATNFALRAHGFPKRSLEGTPEDTVQQVLATYKPYYTDHCQIKTRPYEGIREVLALLKEKYPIAIVSNKPDSAVKALCRDWFPGIYALGESAACPRKPAPDMVYQAMAAIGAESCIYIGDSEVDILTARNASVPCLSVTWGFRDKEMLKEAGAIVFCDIPANIVKTIEEMTHGQ